MKAIAQEISLLGQTYARLLNIRARSDADRKKELVAIRRSLSEQLGRLEHMVNTEKKESIDPELRREFGQRLSRLRAAVAYHQAAWPAVSIDDNPEEFLRAASLPARQFSEFLEWGGKTFGND